MNKCKYKKCVNILHETSKNFCLYHLQKDRDRYKELRNKRKESGICIFCRKDSFGKVVCKECSNKHYGKYKEINKERRRESHIKNREEDNIKNLERYRKRKYGGMYYIVLERDNLTCQICGKTDNLTIHHKDGEGYSSKNPNNNPNNLITLCNSCHGYIHRSWQRFEKNIGKQIICSECNKNKKLWNKTHNCCRKCYTNNHMYQNKV